MDDPHGVFEIAENVLIAGKQENFFRKDLNVQELMLIMLNLPITSMYYRMMAECENNVEMNERVIKLCLNAVR